MNKTVNINLAGIFFHIDENAYLKLQRYLDAIKRSFTDSQGRDEIVADIEARIAELFSEKIKDERQVIGTKEVNEVIEVMGQPEDYRIDEEIFEDEPKESYQRATSSKQLFRDTSNSYVGGVSSGLGHYLGIDAIWLRLAWVLFTIFSSGAFILIYIAFWIFVPEAKTTADELAMRGKPINISNIERKVKEGFNDVADKVKDVDYQKYGNKVKSSSTTFFEALGDVLLVVLKVFVKFIGVLLIIIAGVTLISLFIGLFILGTFNFMNIPGTEELALHYPADAPVWLVSLFTFFLIGIPFFFLFILGLKILINNLKSIGTPAKLALLGVWIISLLGLIVIGVKQATLEAFDEEIMTEETLLPISHNDTVKIKMVGNNRYVRSLYNRNNYKIKSDEQGNRVIVMQDIEIYLKSKTDDTLVGISIEKSAEGSSYDEAIETAKDIRYAYKVDDKTLLLDGYAITDYKNKIRDQEVKVILTLPEGITILADDNTSSYNSSWEYDDYLTMNNKEGKYVTVKNGKLSCEDCINDEDGNDWKYGESDEDEDDDNVKIKINDKDASLKIDEDGLEIKSEDVDIKIDENGVKIETDN